MTPRRVWFVRIDRSCLAGWRTSPAEAVYRSIKSSHGFKKVSFRDRDRFAELLEIVEACADVSLSELAELRRNIADEVVVAHFVEQGLSGPDLGHAFNSARIERIARSQ